MKLLLIVHRDDAALGQFIGAVRKQQLAGFTTMRSSGIGRTSDKHVEEVGIGGFLGFLTGVHQGSNLHNTTLWSLVHDHQMPRVLELLHQYIQDFDAPGGGLYCVLPVESFGGVE
jgi:hypothetical protein